MGSPRACTTQTACDGAIAAPHSGRSRAIVTVKSRGDVTLVGPFRDGKTEGPCRTFPVEAGAPLDEALVEFLEKFIEEAFRP